MTATFLIRKEQNENVRGNLLDIFSCHVVSPPKKEKKNQNTRKEKRTLTWEGVSFCFFVAS